jgi:hypothetical protein
VHRLKPPAKNRRTLAADLAEIARIGALFVDGDALADVFAPGAENWTSGDDVNFKHGPFIDLKRTVLKIERIGDFRYFALVARVRKDDPKMAEAIVCGMRNDLGNRPVPMTLAMKQCLKKDAITTERDATSGAVRACAPIKTTDGDPIGFLLLFV